MRVDLRPHQIKALNEMHDKCILTGGVGSGKSITSLTYFFTRVMGGSLNLNGIGETHGFTNTSISKLLIITPSKKRDKLEWEAECARFSLGKNPEESFGSIQVIIDSWHNIIKYTDITGAFVIFDEQRLVGSGAWVKAFYKIASNNPWILLSATPADVWLDLIPVFVANGFYRNKTDFADQHIIYNRYSKFPKVDRYVQEGKLLKLKRRVLVEMPYERHTTRNIRSITLDHDKELYQKVWKEKWNPWDEEPIPNIAGLIYFIRRVVNQHISRAEKLLEIQKQKKRLIVFYNFTYELEILRSILEKSKIPHSEWNGQKHQEIPDTDEWIYLVQYTAGSDAWNCTTTDSMVFYSLQYSYRTYEQCQGRIDRMNTPYEDLYYYVFRSNSQIDQAIWKALVRKQNFNEKSFTKEVDI